MTTTLEIHPVADLFPMLSEDELNTLAEDIQENGLRNPIVMYEAQVLDGRNRLKACELAGVEPLFVEYEGDDPIAFIVSLNLQRRHMEVGQRACVGVELLPRLEEEAAERLRQSRYGPRGPYNKDLAATATRPPTPRDRAAARAASMVGVSETSIQLAKRLYEQDLELFGEVKRGEVLLQRAVDLLARPILFSDPEILKEVKYGNISANRGAMVLQQRQLGLIGKQNTSVISEWKPSNQKNRELRNREYSADESTHYTGAAFIAETLNALGRMAGPGRELLQPETETGVRGLADIVKYHVDVIVPRLVEAYFNPIDFVKETGA